MNRKCPKCKREYSGYPALSRRKNQYICSDCGRREALEDFGLSADFIEILMAIPDDISADEM